MNADKHGKRKITFHDSLIFDMVNNFGENLSFDYVRMTDTMKHTETPGMIDKGFQIFLPVGELEGNPHVNFYWNIHPKLKVRTYPFSLTIHLPVRGLVHSSEVLFRTLIFTVTVTIWLLIPATLKLNPLTGGRASVAP